MKKFLLSMLAVFAFVFAANAEDAVFDFNNPTGLNPSVTPSESISSGVQVEDMTFTDNGVGISFSTDNSNGVRLWTGTNSFYDLRLYKTTDVTLTAPAGSVITKIVVEGSNWGTSYVTFDGFDVSSMTWTGSESTVAVKVIKSTVKVNKISVTYISSDALIAPTITPDGGEYVEGDEVEVTIAGAAGQDLYYALNSDDVGDAQEYTDPLKVTSNTTVYAWASDGSQTSEAASATFNFTAPLENIAAFYTLTKGNAAKFTKTMTAVYQNGNNLIVKDDSGTMLVYGSVGQTYNNGDVIAAGVRGSVGEYGGNKQLSPSSDSFVAGTAGTAITPVVKTVSELSACAFLDYVKLEGVYFTLDEGKTRNYTVSDGTNTFAVYNQFNITFDELVDGAKYSIVGFVSSYNSNAQLQITEVTMSETPKVAQPTFSPEGGVYDLGTELEVVISAEEGTTITYCLDEEDVTKAVAYTEPIKVKENTTIYAWATKDGETSAVASATYEFIETIKYKLATTITSGKKYLMVAEGKVAIPLPKNYGYLSVADVTVDEENVIRQESAVNALTFTAVEGGYTIMDSNEKYLYQTGSYNSFNVSTEMPETGAVWTVEPQDDSSMKITNVAVSKYIQYSTTYTSYGSYSAESGVMPKLYEEVGNSSSAIECVEVEAENVPVEYYNLQGVRVSRPENGIFIRKQGSHTTKVVL